jgi:hypothetical protein
MGTTTTAGVPGIPQPTAANPYGMSPSLQSFMQSLQGMGKALDATTPNSSQYMRPNPGQAWTPGTPNNLLATILAMRNSQMQGMAAPYQQGVAMPRVSLLQG